MLTVELKAPINMYRVVGVDTFSDEDFIVGDYSTSSEAIKVSQDKGGQMTMMYVYDDNGKNIFQVGTY